MLWPGFVSRQLIQEAPNDEEEHPDRGRQSGNYGILADYVRHEGYIPPVASDGEMAPRFVFDREIDLILLVMMPKMDSFEICRTSQNLPCHHHGYCRGMISSVY